MNTTELKINSESEWLEWRKQDITSSEVATLFGCSPYSTLFELWHRKKEKLDLDINNERTRWGQRLEDAIAQGTAEEHALSVSSADVYIRDSELKIGSSFDYWILCGSGNRDGLLEVKNVDSWVFKQEWIQAEGKTEAPPHIELQVQHQMLVTGLEYCYLSALVGGNRLVTIKRNRNEDVIAAIKVKVKEFWESINSHIEPSPIWEKDHEFISKELYQYAVRGKQMKATSDITTMADEYLRVKEEEQMVKGKINVLKAKLYTHINDHSFVKGETFNINAAANKNGVRSLRITRHPAI